MVTREVTFREDGDKESVQVVWKVRVIPSTGMGNKGASFRSFRIVLA